VVVNGVLRFDWGALKIRYADSLKCRGPDNIIETQALAGTSEHLCSERLVNKGFT
jgi:hypothetical protein